MDVYEIYALFRQFGQVHNILNKVPRRFQIDFATIIDKRIASVRPSDIRIDGHKFQVQFDKAYYVPINPNPSGEIERLNDEWSVAPAIDSKQNIVHAIDNDCLLLIFNALDLCDLFNVAYVCRRFKSFAKQSFQSRYGRQRFRLFEDLRGIWPNLSLSQIQLFLQAFGTEIRILHVENDLNTEILLRLCVDHCPAIESLELHALCWNDNLDKDIRRLMPQLKQFAFHSTELCSMGDLFVGDWPMERLEIKGWPDWTTTTINLPKLTELNLIMTCSTERIIKRFLEENLLESPHIRKLKLENFSFSGAVLDHFATYLPSHLNELTFERCDVNMKDTIWLFRWSKFTSLEALSIFKCPGSHFPIKQMLRKLAETKVPLKTLSVDGFAWMGGDLIAYITPLKQLETIIFHEFHHDIDIIHLAQNLDKLSRLIFKSATMKASEIKAILRQIGQPFRVSIRIEAKTLIYDVPENDCEEIDELVQATQMKINLANLG